MIWLLIALILLLAIGARKLLLHRMRAAAAKEIAEQWVLAGFKIEQLQGGSLMLRKMEPVCPMCGRHWYDCQCRSDLTVPR